MPTIRFLDAALADVAETAVYLGDSSPAAAFRFLRAVDLGARRLSRLPRMGRRVRLGVARLREVRSWPVPGFPKHLVFYIPIENGIEVLRVLHGARDLPAVLGGEEE